MNCFAIDDRIYYPREKATGTVTFANEAGDVGIICLDDGRRFALAASQVEPEPDACDACPYGSCDTWPCKDGVPGGAVEPPPPDPDALPCGHDRGALHSDGKGEWWYEDECEGER